MATADRPDSDAQGGLPGTGESGLPDEPGWPAPDGARVLLLLDAASTLEEQLLEEWATRHEPERADYTMLSIPCSRRKRAGAIDPGLEPALATGDDPLCAPVRVAWLPDERKGRRSARLTDLLKLGDPRDPDPLRARWILRRHPERCRIVAGEPAPASALRDRWRRHAGSDAGSTLGLAEFVARQAALALERAERKLRGARYKVPRFVKEDILSRPAFRGELGRLARELGEQEPRVTKRATRYLREIAATHSPFVIDIVAELWRRMVTRGYGQLHYETRELDGVRALSQQHPVVFLPTHKSNLDHGVLQYLLHDNGLPPNHTAGGINMNFFPLGPLVRRSGVFFIRRTFKDNEVYKAVLRHYVDFLVEKRFPLEWYIEGGRSRSGKLLPPRFGLLAYVVDAYRRGRSEDVQLLPISICYDQISDVGSYAAEQLGAVKEKEGFGWFVRFIRSMGRRYGSVFVRFGEPVSLRKALGPADPDAEPDPDEESLALQKLAFEVCVRINEATPITPVSLVCLALLGRGDRALSVDEMVGALRNLVDVVHRRDLATTEALDLESPDGVQRTLEALVENDLLTRYDEGAEPVYAIARGQHLAAAYYRNTIIHYFVTGAIGELSLLKAAEDGIEDRRQAFWDEALELRDLLKFEFFFAEKEIFLGELRRDLALHDARWEDALDKGADAITAVLPQIRPYSAHRVLRPFLEAYRVVGDVLEGLDPAVPLEEGAFLKECLALGRQYVLQRHIKASESVSKVLFATALKLARNRGLVDPDGDADLAALRRAFAAEIRDGIRRVDAVEALVRARRAGILGD